MKTTATLLIGILVLSQGSFAAVPKNLSGAYKTLPGSDLTLPELLLMPEPNRLALSLGKNEFYAPLIESAFNEKNNMDQRWKSLTLAAAIKKEKSEPQMMKAIADKQWFMRNAALLAIQSYSQAAAEAVALKLLSDKALVVRSAAVTVLTKSNQQTVRDRLWAEYHHNRNVRNKQNLWIRAQILEHLAKSPRVQEQNLFAKIAKDNDVKLRKLASLSLKSLEKPSSAPLQ